MSCSLQDMLRSLDQRAIPVQNFADHWAVQLNDTHPAIAVPELMRLLIDERQLGGMRPGRSPAAPSPTPTTLLPGAPNLALGLFGDLLPRHLEIVFEINSRFLQQVRLKWPGDTEVLEAVDHRRARWQGGAHGPPGRGGGPSRERGGRAQRPGAVAAAAGLRPAPTPSGSPT